MNSLIFPYTPFLDELFARIGADGIDVSRYFMDHICYRVATVREYDEIRVKISEIGILLSEKEIGGRPISTYKLADPLSY
jgi:predicted metalloenzyme YecM